MEVGAAYNSRTVEEVFRDFKARRAALLKALNTDVSLFFQQCDPEKENLCLYGDPSGEWRVNLPAYEVPPEIPEPALGINFARDGMQKKDWLALVAAHSDAWLLAVAFYFGGRFQFDKNDRKRLFNMINELPTIYETVTGSANKVKDKATNANHGSHKSKSASKSAAESNGKNAKVKQAREDYEDGTEDADENEEVDDDDDDDDDDDGEDDGDDDEHGETLCGACGDNYSSDEFWIGCDICEKWFHGKCVNITPARAEHIKQYKCPSCSNKRARH